MRVAATVSELSGNVLGRAFALWLLARQLGWEFLIVGPPRGALWEPLRGHPLEELVVSRTDAELASIRRRFDVVIALKPLPESLRLARELAAGELPLIVDIDDPDLDVAIARMGFGQRSRFSSPHRLIKGTHPIQLRRTRASLAGHPLIVSNPQLQQLYGGVVIPHVRPPRHSPRGLVSRSVVGFVGTVRPHKGVDVLRRAIEEVRRRRDIELYVTDRPPRDSRPWERWVGPQPIADLEQTLSHVHISAVPSLAEGYGPLQLPVKLIDGMALGLPVVASDLPPIRWCAQDSVLLVPPGNVSALAEALCSLFDDDDLAMRLGRAAHARAVAAFSPHAVAPVFADVVRRAVRVRPSHG